MMEHDNVRKRMYTCMSDWVTLLYSRKLTEHCKPAIMEKIKTIIKFFKINFKKEFPGGLAVKDPGLSLLWLKSLL